MVANLNDYKEINLIGIALSATLIMGFMNKVLFNYFATVYIPMDKWTIAEFLNAFINIIIFLYF